MAKKSITFLKIENFLNTHPIILFFQHNNLSVKQWLDFRIQLKNFENIDILVLKNTLIENLLAQLSTHEKNKLASLFQGPCFALGLSNSSQIQDVLKVINKKPTVFLLGGIFENQPLNHLDISKILELNFNVYPQFISNLDQSSQLYNVLSSPLNNTYKELNQVPYNLLQCLQILQLKKQGDFIV